MKHRKLPGQMIICFLLMGFIASFLSGCGSHTKVEEAPDAVTLTSMGESGESDLINEISLSLQEHEIYLNDYEVSQDLLAIYIEECFNDDIDLYLSYLEDFYGMDFENSLGELNFWASTHYLIMNLEDIGIDLDLYGINPYDLMFYVDERFGGDIEDFLLALDEWYEGDFEYFSGFFEDYLWDMQQNHLAAFEKELLDNGIDLEHYQVDVEAFAGFLDTFSKGDVGSFIEYLEMEYAMDFSSFLISEYPYTHFASSESKIFADDPNAHADDLIDTSDPLNPRLPYFSGHSYGTVDEEILKERELSDLYRDSFRIQYGLRR